MATIEIWSQHSEPEVPAAGHNANNELAALYGALWPRLLNRVRFKWRIRGELAEDLVHDAWVRAIEHYDRFDRDRPFEPWALRILDNVVIDHLRRTRTGDGHARQLPVDFDEIHLDVPAGAVHDVDRVGDRDLLSRAMATLPPRQQATAVGVLVDGLSLDETAERMELSNTACRQLLHRARVGLRRALLDQGMLPGLAPLWWLRQRLVAAAQRLGGPEASAVAGSAATVVAVVVAVAVTIGATTSQAIARDRLAVISSAARDEAADSVARKAARASAATAAAPNQRSSSKVSGGAPQRPSAEPPARPEAPALVPDTRVPVVGARVNQTRPEDPEYAYGVKLVADPVPTEVDVTVETKRDDTERLDYSGPHNEAACEAFAAAPAGYCRRSEP